MKQLILMADVIGSGQLGSKKLMSDFKKLISSANKNFKDQYRSPLTITLGDEFQGIVSNLKATLEIILFLEEEIIRKHYDFKLRYSLLEGTIDTKINKKEAYEMLGPGLTNAREKLAELKNTNNRFLVSLTSTTLSDILNNCFYLLQNIIDKWNPERDYKLVEKLMEHGDYKIVADTLKKNRSLIWKREKSLNIESYNAIKNIIYSTIKLI